MARYALAIFGVHLGFIPLFILLLPRRVEAIAPAATVETLSWILLVGGIVAGLAHIVAGHVSDGWYERHGSRRGLIAIGAALLGASYVALAFATNVATLFGATIFLQIALNCAFAPLGALLADHFDDRVKGRMAGMMNAALPASSLAISPLGWAFPQDSPWAFLLVGCFAVAFMLPLLVRWNMAGPAASPSPVAEDAPPATRHLRHDFILAWAARLVVQLGAAFVLSYLYVYVGDIVAGHGEGGRRTASDILSFIAAPIAIIAMATTLATGHWSDVWRLRRAPLAVAALLFAIGLAILAGATSVAAFLIAFGLFQIGLSAFLSVDAALVAQLVAAQRNRGLLLGAMNLTNTLPAIIAPILTLLVAQENQVGAMLAPVYLACAIGAAGAAVLLLRIRSVR